MSLWFYQWFLQRLIEALSRLQLEHVEPAVAVTITPQQHVHDSVVTPRQSNLTGRPRTQTEVTNVSGGWYALGDGPRMLPPLFQSRGGAVPLPVSDAWLPPWPLMPPQAEPTSVAWDGPTHAAHSWYQAEDGLFDLYPRDSGSVCPPLISGVSLVEPTGVFAHPAIRRCLADYKTRPEHLGTDDRFNLRLPVMAGVDETGRYVRAIEIPLKTFEYR